MVARNNIRKAEMITTDYYRGKGMKVAGNGSFVTFDRLPKTANVIENRNTAE